MRHGLLSESQANYARLAGSFGLRPWPTLLVVDGDAGLLSQMVCFLEKRGFHVAAATTIAEAAAFCHRRRDWALVISEYHLADGTGLELCCWMQEQSGMTTVPFLITSGKNCSTLCTGTEYLAKPFQLEELDQRIQSLVKR